MKGIDLKILIICCGVIAAGLAPCFIAIGFRRSQRQLLGEFDIGRGTSVRISAVQWNSELPPLIECVVHDPGGTRRERMFSNVVEIRKWDLKLRFTVDKSMACIYEESSQPPLVLIFAVNGTESWSTLDRVNGIGINIWRQRYNLLKKDNPDLPRIPELE